MTMLQQTFGNSTVRTVVQLLTAPAGPAAPIAGPMHVKVDGLNVRRAAHKAADNIVGTLNRHDVVESSGSEGEWVKIEFHGKPAFVFGHYVEPAAPKRPVDATPAAASAPADAHQATAPAPTASSASSAPTVAPSIPLPAHQAAAPPTATAIPASTAPTVVAHAHDATDGHVAPQAQVDAKKAADKPSDKDKKKDQATAGYSKSAGQPTHTVLTRLANAGKLKITPNEIMMLDGASQIESGGRIGCIDTTDDQVVSIGFFQFVLGHKSIEQVMHMAPAAFAKYGLELDPSKTYAFGDHPHQIKGCEDYQKLRTPEWGDKFLQASLDDDVIVASARLALKEEAQVQAITVHAGGKGDYFADGTARAWLLELHNNRPSNTRVAVEKAVAAGARDAKDRDKFLDILAGAIEDSYAPEGVNKYHHAKALPENKKLTPEQEEKLLHKYVAAARLKGTHITQRISRHAELPKLEPVVASGGEDHHDKAAPPIAQADGKVVPPSVGLPATPAHSAPGHAQPSMPTQDRQASRSHAETHTGPTAPVPSLGDQRAQAEPAPFDALDPEYTLVLGQAEAGVLSVEQATEKFAAFDRVLHNGAPSVRGSQLVKQLPTEIASRRAAAVAKKDQNTPAKPTTAISAKPATTPSAKTQAVPNTTWTPPPNSQITNHEIVALASKVHDPRVDALLEHIGGIEQDAKLAQKQTGGGTSMEYTKPEFRDKLVEGIAVVRRELEQLDASDPNVAPFKLAVNHEIQLLAPYHFQKNIRAIETWDKSKSLGGIRQWSTCNLTSLAMCLETVGINSRNFPAAHEDLLAIAGPLFEVDLHNGSDDQGGKYLGAQLTGKGVGPVGGHTSVEQIKALRFPDFLEFAAIVYSTVKGKYAHDEHGVIKGAGDASIAKAGVPYLKGLASFMGAKPTEVTLNLGKASLSFLNDYGAKHRGITAPGVEKMNTARNLMENADAREKTATNDKERQKSEKERAAREGDYKALDKANHKWLDDPEAEQKVPLEQYKQAVTSQLGPHLDAGRGAIAGLSGHYVRLFAIDEIGIRVQDPGQWNRSEMRITWAEARAMGYFWTNLVIGS